MKKRIIGSALIIAGVLSLCACESSVKDYDKNATVNKIESKDYSFINTTDMYIAKKDKITAYYVNDSDFIYVDAKSYLESLEGVFDLSGVTFSATANTLTIKANDESLTITPDGNKISMTNAGVLNITADSETIDFMANTQFENSYNKEGSSINYDLSNYSMNIFKYDDLFLVPFDLINDLYGAANYYNVYFNYDKFYGTYPYVDSENEYEEDILTSHKSSTIEMRKHNYNNMAFVFENLYGLKESQGFKSFDDLVGADNKKLLLSTNPDRYNTGYANLFTYKLDEGHSYIVSAGYEGSEGLLTFGYGNRLLKMVTDYSALMSDSPLMNAEDNSNCRVTYYGDTAMISFSDFLVGSDEDLYDKNGNLASDAYYYDTFYMVKHYLDEAKDRNIKNIIFDLSLNGGGYIVAFIKALGLITNDNIYYGVEDAITGEIQVEEYSVDADCDGDYKDNDAYTDFKYYALTSHYTYSAANAFATYIKEKNIGKVIGRKAGGGKCSVLPVVLGDGTSMAISSTNWSGVGFVDEIGNPSVVSYELGVDVDITLDLKDFYNLEKINSLLD